MEIRDLLPLARTLSTSAESLEALGVKAPGIPDAGYSTGQVGEALTSIFRTMSTLVQAAAAASDRVEEHSGCYLTVENDNAHGIAAAGGGQ